MTDELPIPLVPSEVDLRDFPFMPLDIRRLLTSETWIEAADDPKLGHVLVCLWCESWHQVPAASLPSNERVLARLAMCTGAEWAALRDRAMEGWVKCSDGLWYHPVVAEKALEAWEGKWNRPDRAEERSEHGRRAAQARWKNRRVVPEQCSTDAQSMPEQCSTDAQSMPEQCSTDALRGTGTGTEKEKEIKKTPSASPREGGARATRLPADWSPDDGCRAYAAERGLDPDLVTEAFRDHWHASNAAAATKRDWSAAWRTWCRREIERPTRGVSNGRKGPVTSLFEGAALALAAREGGREPERQADCGADHDPPKPLLDG